MLRRTILLIALALLLPGCQAIASMVETVLPIVTQMSTALDAVDAAAKTYFAENPAPEVEKTYQKLMAKAQLALGVVASASKAAKATTDHDLAKAFTEFKQAYADLLNLLGPLGVVAPSKDGSFGAPLDGPLQVPAPDTLRLE